MVKNGPLLPGLPGSCSVRAPQRLLTTLDNLFAISSKCCFTMPSPFCPPGSLLSSPSSELVSLSLSPPYSKFCFLLCSLLHLAVLPSSFDAWSMGEKRRSGLHGHREQRHAFCQAACSFHFSFLPFTFLLFFIHIGGTRD